MEIFLLFSRTLTFFTLLAEGIFIIILIRVLSDPAVVAQRKLRRLITSAVLIFFLFIFLFAGEYLCGLVVPLDRGYHRLIYRVVAWDLVATLYVLLEGIILVLACRLYQVLYSRAWGDQPLTAGYGVGVVGTTSIWLMILLFLSGFVWFEYGAVPTAISLRLNNQEILNMAFFYRIVAGWFWTFFEAALAFKFMKIYLLMKHGEAKAHADR